tara:strand:+ start:9035 stop:9838 length:804 start_codon:yes stop_codon:yes gene_type:complete
LKKITVLGASGKMGKAIITSISEAADCQLISAVCEQQDPNLGKDAGENSGLSKLGVNLVGPMSDFLSNSDVVIDFTLPDALENNLVMCVEKNVPMTIGVTGLSKAQFAAINEASNSIPILYERNMSIGINALLSVIKTLSKILDKSFDTEIIEAHHRHKIDSPSGTAIAIGEAIAQAKNLKFSDMYDPARQSNRSPRAINTIGISSVRGGGFIGDHTVSFTSEEESIEIKHHAIDRKCFAQGAVLASKWLIGKEPALYSMNDVLGLK